MSCKGGYMFKKILNKIEDLSRILDTRCQCIAEELKKTRNNEGNVTSLAESLKYYAGLSNQVITGSYENDNNTFEAVVFIPYRGKPLVFKDGKKISTDDMTSFDVDWSFDRKTEVTIRNE